MQCFSQNKLRILSSRHELKKSSFYKKAKHANYGLLARNVRQCVKICEMSHQSSSILRARSHRVTHSLSRFSCVDSRIDRGQREALVNSTKSTQIRITNYRLLQCRRTSTIRKVHRTRLFARALT